MEATVIIGALCTALGAVCGYFIRRENVQYAFVNERLDKLTDVVAKLTVTVSELLAIATANANADEKQNETMATILDRALNCQQCFRGPIQQKAGQE